MPVARGIHNPYAGATGRWLKGEIHAHVCKAIGIDGRYSDGASTATIYADAADAELDFVCMSVDAVDSKAGGSVAQFGDVGSGRKRGVIGIPAREIQNNFFASEEADSDYFGEAGAEYLHVLTVEQDGISICLHPTYYELIRPRPGGAWREIRSALLNARPTSNLGRLKVSGIEIYNGFVMRKLLRGSREAEYSEYDERCWDEMLMKGRRYWGFCGNDSFFHESDELETFSPLGVTYALVPGKATAGGIAASLRDGRFYASTGVRLADTPIVVTQDGAGIHVATYATASVDWTAKIFRRVGRGWKLTTQHVNGSDHAEFTTGSEWRYIRVQCENPRDSWRRAWLQPITRNA